MKGAALMILVATDEGFLAALSKELRDDAADNRLRSPIFIPKLNEPTEKAGTEAIRRRFTDDFRVELREILPECGPDCEPWTVKEVRPSRQYVPKGDEASAKPVEYRNFWYSFRGTKACFVAVVTTRERWEASALAKSGSFALYHQDRVLGWGGEEMAKSEVDAYRLAFGLADQRRKRKAA